MAKCMMCGCDSDDRAEWDGYNEMCPTCSYADHVEQDTKKFESLLLETVTALKKMVAVPLPAARQAFAVSTVRSALEVFVKAFDADNSFGLKAETDHAAGMAVRLANLLVMGAPAAVVDHHMHAMHGAVARDLASREVA